MFDPGGVMDGSLLSASKALLCVSVFAMYFCLSRVCIFSLVIKKVREAKGIFRQKWERLEYASQMDEEQISSWPWIISVLASVNDAVASRCPLFGSLMVCNDYYEVLVPGQV